MYATVAREFATEQRDDPGVKALLDSALREMDRVENLNSEQPNRLRIAVALLTNAPTEESIGLARGIVKNESLKLTILQRMAYTLAYRGELFKATAVMPLNLSESDRLDFLWYIQRGYADSQPLSPEWKEYENIHEFWRTMRWVPYVDETN